MGRHSGYQEPSSSLEFGVSGTFNKSLLQSRLFSGLYAGASHYLLLVQVFVNVANAAFDLGKSPDHDWAGGNFLDPV